MKKNLKQEKMWQQSLGKYSKRLIIANNSAELCEVMEESYKLFSKLTNNCSKHNKPKKASKVMLSLKRFIFLCKMSNEKFENSTEEQDSFTSIVSRFLSILIEISFTTGSLDDAKTCADITTFLVLHLGHSPEYLVDSILRVVNVFKRCSQTYSLLYWKVWQLAEKNLTNPLYLKCLLLAKYWTRHLKLSERKPYIKSAKALPLDSISRNWINERLEAVGVSRIHKKKKLTKSILSSLKLNVRKALKKIFFGKQSNENASKHLQLIEAEVLSDKEEEASDLFFIDRQGVSKVGTEDAKENDDENEETTISVNKNTDDKSEKNSGLDQNQSDNDDECCTPIEIEVESGSDEEATDNGGNNAESKIIVDNPANVDKHPVVNILEDLEVHFNASPVKINSSPKKMVISSRKLAMSPNKESSSVKKAQKIESNYDEDKGDNLRNSIFSLQINEESNSDSDDEDNLRNKALSEQINEENNSETEDSDNYEENNLRNKSFSNRIDEENNSEGEESDNDEEKNSEGEDSDNDEENNLRNKSLSNQIDEKNSVGKESDNDKENNLRNESLSKQIDENYSDIDDDESFKSIETEIESESDEEVDEKATDNSGDNAESKIIANTHAIVDKHSVVNIVEDLEVHFNASPVKINPSPKKMVISPQRLAMSPNKESSSMKKDKEIESNCDKNKSDNLPNSKFSQQVNEESNSESGDDEDNLRNITLSKSIYEENEDEESDNDEENYLKNETLSKQIDEENNSDNEESDEDEENNLRNRTFSKEIHKENNSESEVSEEFTYGKRKKKSSPCKVRNSLIRISPRIKVESKVESGSKTLGKRVGKQTIELIETSDINDESEESQDELEIFNLSDEDTEIKKGVIDDNSSSEEEICKKLDFFEESILEVSGEENDSGDDIQSKNKKTGAVNEISDDELSNHKIKSPSVVIRRVSETLQDEEKDVSSPKKSTSPEPQSPITKTPSGLILGSLTRKSLRSHNSLISNESDAIKSTINGLFSSANKDFSHFETESPQSIASILKNIPSLLKSGTPSPVKINPSPKKMVISPQRLAMSPNKDFVVTEKSSISSPQKSPSVAKKSKTLSLQKTLASPQKSEPNSPTPRKSLLSQHKGQTQSPRNSILAHEEFKTASPQKSLTSPQESKSNSPASKNDQTLSLQKSLKRPLSENSSIKGSVEDSISETENDESVPKVARRTSKRLATPLSSTRLRNRVSRNIPRIEEVDECLESVISEDDSAPKPARSTSGRVATPASPIRLRNRVSRNTPRIEEVDDRSESISSSPMKRKSAVRENNKKIVEKTPTKKAPSRVQSTPTTTTRLRSRRPSVLSEIGEEKEDEPVMPKKRMTTTIATTETNIKEERARSVSPANVRYSKRLRSRDAQTVATSRIIPITRKQDPTSAVVLVKRLEEEYPNFVNNRYFIKPDIGSDSKVQNSGSVQKGNSSPDVITFDSPQTNNPNEIVASSPNSSFTSEDFRNYHTIKTLPCAALETPKRRFTRSTLGNEVKRITPKNDERDSKFFNSTPRCCKSVYRLRPKS